MVGFLLVSFLSRPPRKEYLPKRTNPTIAGSARGHTEACSLGPSACEVFQGLKSMAGQNNPKVKGLGYRKIHRTWPQNTLNPVEFPVTHPIAKGFESFGAKERGLTVFHKQLDSMPQEPPLLGSCLAPQPTKPKKVHLMFGNKTSGDACQPGDSVGECKQHQQEGENSTAKRVYGN